MAEFAWKHIDVEQAFLPDVDDYDCEMGFHFIGGEKRAVAEARRVRRTKLGLPPEVTRRADSTVLRP